MLDNESDSAVLWEHRFDDLRAWKSAHGDCNVPKAEGKLGRWVVRQRELHKKGKLEGERRTKLDNLGFVWNTNEAAWEHKYALLVKYNDRHSHCCVPISDPTLGMWVAKMRANRRRNKLAQHRIEKLDALSFVWNTAEADWMDKYSRLLAFRAANGHACVPFNEGELGWWVNTQRQNKRKQKLAPHREALLNEADFVWAPQEFLAARRRSQAAQRASAAHRLAAASTRFYAPPPYPPAYTHHYPAAPPPQSLARYPPPPSRSPRKRPHPTLPPVQPAVKPDQTVLSPTSVKRAKLCSPLPPARPWAGAGPPLPPPPPLPQGPPRRARAVSPPRTHSIASLLCPSGEGAVGLPLLPAPRAPAPKFGDPGSKLDLLSSICGLPRIAAAPQAGGDGGPLVLPPISTLRGFTDAASGADR